MRDEELFYRLALTQLPGIGSLFAKLLVEYFDGAMNFFKAKKGELSKIPGIGAVMLDNILSQQNRKQALAIAEKELKFVERTNVRVLFFDDDNYPSRLKECEDGPFVLFYRGADVLNQEKVLAMIGTRKPSVYGKDICGKIIKGIAHLNPLIVSGLAYGVDTCAHENSVQNDLSTIGVLAHGLDRIYPSRNKKISESMLEKGGLLTEFFSGTNPDRENFPKRNRIVAGMSDATLIIEGAIKGGAMITTRLAHSYGREVLAVPGRTIDGMSGGCNHLIKTQVAQLVESAGDISKHLGWEEMVVEPQNYQTNIFTALDPNEEKVLQLIRNEGITNKDMLARAVGLPIHKMSSLLFNMELNGYLRAVPGNCYQVKV